MGIQRDSEAIGACKWRSAEGESGETRTTGGEERRKGRHERMLREKEKGVELFVVRSRKIAGGCHLRVLLSRGSPLSLPSLSFSRFASLFRPLLTRYLTRGASSHPARWLPSRTTRGRKTETAIEGGRRWRCEAKEGRRMVGADSEHS